MNVYVEHLPNEFHGFAHTICARTKTSNERGDDDATRVAEPIADESEALRDCLHLPETQLVGKRLRCSRVHTVIVQQPTDEDQ
jgi:hypothetical protein